MPIKYNDKWYIPKDELMQKGISNDNLRVYLNMNRNGKLNGWEHIYPSKYPDIGINNKQVVWIDVESIPAKTREKYALPSSQELQALAEIQAQEAQLKAASLSEAEKEMQRKNALVAAVKQDISDYKYYHDIKTTDNKCRYTDAQKHGLSRAAAWLRFLASLKRNVSEWGYTTKDLLLADALCIIKQEEAKGEVYGLHECGSVKSLYRYITKWNEQDRDAVVSGRMGNVNRLKIDDKVGAIIRNLYSHHNKPDCMDVMIRYELERIKDKTLPALDISTIKKYVAMPKVQQIIKYERYGDKEGAMMLEQYIGRRRTKESHNLWIGDGSEFELYFKHETVTEKVDKETGEVKTITTTNYWKRFYWFFWIDAATDNIIGYSLAEIGTRERMELVFDSLKQAVQNTGYLPTQMNFDKGSGLTHSDLVAIYPQFAKYAFATGTGNAKAKRIEPVWRLFCKKVLANTFENYSGLGVKAGKEYSLNRDWYNKNKEKVAPDEEGCKLQVKQAVAIWNEKHPLLAETNGKKAGLDAMISIFWIWAMKRGTKERQPYEYGTGGITFQLNKVKRRYRVYDERESANDVWVLDLEFWRTYAMADFYIKYDPTDMDLICLYDKDEKFIAYANEETEARKLPEAIADYKEGDGERIQTEIANRKNFNKANKQKAKADKEEYATPFLEMDKADAEGILKAYAGINGQHKELNNVAEAIVKGEPETVTKTIYPKKGMDYFSKYLTNKDD